MLRRFGKIYNQGDLYSVRIITQSWDGRRQDVGENGLHEREKPKRDGQDRGGGIQKGHQQSGQGKEA